MALSAFGALAGLLAGAGALVRVSRNTPAAFPPHSTASAVASSAEGSAFPPPVVRSFLAEGFGAAAPDAPSENQFFAQLVGVWQCALRLDDGSSAFPSTWAFKHSMDGFAVEHLYFQAQENLVPPLRALRRDLQSKAKTLYDPATGGWRFLGVSNIAGAGLGEATQAMAGTLRDGALVFRKDASNREVFANVSHRSFAWRKEQSPDNGATWELTVLIECRRQEWTPSP